VNKLQLDLEPLDVERLDITVTGLDGGLDSFRMGHAATELGHSCECDECGGSCSHESE
jgi:hypothetical protein